MERAKKRLGKDAEKVKWIVSDITSFAPETHYDIWHDRATFHFLTTPEQIAKYIGIAERYVTGYMIIGTFSVNGPTKCSGLEIMQYDEQSLPAKLENKFDKLSCMTEDHTTPFNTSQNFIFCSFKKRKD